MLVSVVTSGLALSSGKPARGVSCLLPRFPEFTPEEHHVGIGSDDLSQSRFGPKGQQFIQPGLSALENDVNAEPEACKADHSVFELIERNERPFRPCENFGGVDSRAEGPWLGERMALWAGSAVGAGSID